MTEQEIAQILDWMGNPENFDSLSFLDKTKIGMAHAEFMEKVEPIVKRAMSKDKKSTFLFKM